MQWCTVTSSGGSLTVSSVQTYTPTSVSEISAYAFSADGTQLAILWNDDIGNSYVDIINTATGGLNHRVSVPLYSDEVCWTGDYVWISFYTTGTYTTVLINAATGSFVGGSVSGVVMGAIDDTYAILSNGWGGPTAYAYQLVGTTPTLEATYANMGGVPNYNLDRRTSMFLSNGYSAIVPAAQVALPSGFTNGDFYFWMGGTVWGDEVITSSLTEETVVTMNQCHLSTGIITSPSPLSGSLGGIEVDLACSDGTASTVLGVQGIYGGGASVAVLLTPGDVGWHVGGVRCS